VLYLWKGGHGREETGRKKERGGKGKGIGSEGWRRGEKGREEEQRK